MKPGTPFAKERNRWAGVVLLGAVMASRTVFGAETNAPAAAAPVPMTPQEMFEGGTKSYNNWIELGGGGFITSGNKAQFQQMHQNAAGSFGGISDFHYQRDLDKTTALTADGRALFDEHDYRLSLGVTREKLGFLRFSFSEFRTWYNGDGGYYPPSNLGFPLSANALAIDRGEISFEGGLRLEKVPNITFKYTRSFREGGKSSTSWGYSGVAAGQGVAPSFRDIDEHSDAFQLDVTHRIKATDFGLGFRYETGKLDDALKISQYPDQPFRQKITDRQGTTYDLFNAHAFTETWIRKNLLFSTAYSFSDMDGDFFGSRIYGADFDVGYVPNAQQTAFSYYGLNGGSRMQEYVMDLNLLWKPATHLSIVPSLRVMKEYLDADFNGYETLLDDAAKPFNGTSSRDVLDVRERLDARYTGFTNWVITLRGDWTEGDGNLTESGGLKQMLVGSSLTGVAPIDRHTDDSRFFQKYSAEAKWYITRRVSVDFGGYFKINDYNYDHGLDSTPNNSADRYPAYLVMQSFQTWDGLLRLTLKPRQNLSLISRYEYQVSTIHTQPDPVSGLGEVDSSRMTSHILAQNINWFPWSRLSLQAGFNYVLSETKTPASDYTQAILNAQNNYWTVTLNSTVVLDDKTDLNLGYVYYRADDYVSGSNPSLPPGSGAEEHSVTATLSRRLTQNVRLNLKGGYFRYQDAAAGGNNNYNACLVYSSVQYRF
jgi:hypothetical protein